VSTVASVAEHLRHAGYKIRLVTDTGTDLDGSDGDTALIDHLAEVQLSDNGNIADVVAQVRRRSDGGLVIAVLGSLDDGEAEVLSALRRSGTSCIAFMINSMTWLNLDDEERDEADRVHAAAGLVLLRSGWRVIDVPHGAKLAALWPQVARGSGFTLRAAMAETVSGGVR
jgi:hypothetical protein